MAVEKGGGCNYGKKMSVEKEEVFLVLRRPKGSGSRPRCNEDGVRREYLR